MWAALLAAALGWSGVALVVWRRRRPRPAARGRDGPQRARRLRGGTPHPEARSPRPTAERTVPGSDAGWLDTLVLARKDSPSPAAPAGAVDLTVALGTEAGRPLVLRLPLLVEPPPGAAQTSRLLRIALAQAATAAGAALVSGAGPFLPEERADAARWILRWGRGVLRHGPGVLALADMVEIPVGPWGPAGTPAAARRPLPRRIRRTGPRLLSPARLRRGPCRPVAAWIRAARRVHPHIPVAVRLPATPRLEADIAAATALGVDVVTLDGLVPPAASGLPAAWAVARARRWLEQHGLARRVQLVVRSPVRHADDIVKLLALGADTVVVGRGLFPAAPGQASRAGRLPFTRRRDDALDLDRLALDATRRLYATRDDLARALRSLGAASLGDLGPECLLAGSWDVAAALGPADHGDRPPALLVELRALVATYRAAIAVLGDLCAFVPRLYGITGSHPRPPR